jgi:hypothetical protein
MSTNISELLYRMEQAGLSKAEANEIALKLIIAGQQSVVAARSEEVLRRVDTRAAAGVREVLVKYRSSGEQVSS